MIKLKNNKNYILYCLNIIILKFNLCRIFCFFLVFLIHVYDFNNYSSELNKLIKLNSIYLLEYINLKLYCLCFYLIIIRLIPHVSVAEMIGMFFSLFIGYILLFLDFFLIKFNIFIKLFFKVCYFISFYFKLISVFFKDMFFEIKFWFIKTIKPFCKVFIIVFLYCYLLYETFNFYVFCVLAIYLNRLTWLVSFLVYCVLLFNFVCNGEIILINPLMSDQYDLYPPLVKDLNLTPSYDELLVINEERLGHTVFFTLFTVFIVFTNGRFFY